MEQALVEKLAAEIEAVLFIFGEPVDIKKLASTLKSEEGDIKTAVQFLSLKLSEPGQGIMLMENNGRYMLSTKAEHASLVEKFITEDLKEELTPAALETLSIVTYFGPLTRAQIDYLRGVNSSFILRSLLIRGLVERKIAKGLAYDYEVSFDFLKHIGVNHVSKMPNYNEYQKLKDRYFSSVVASQEPVASNDAITPTAAQETA